MKVIELNNDKQLKEAKNFFTDTTNIITVDKDHRVLSGVEGNIYAIYVDKKIKYIGERQSGKITSRLNHHFHKCPSGTNSKLKQVNEAFNSNQEVGYKTLNVTPDFERYSVETYLIQSIDGLEWNVRDKKGKREMEISGSSEIALINTEE